MVLCRTLSISIQAGLCCWKCTIEAVGYDAYSFKLKVADIKNEGEFLAVVGAESAGSTLFKCVASRFALR